MITVKLRIVLGNHDRAHPLHEHDTTYYLQQLTNMTTVQTVSLFDKHIFYINKKNTTKGTCLNDTVGYEKYKEKEAEEEGIIKINAMIQHFCYSWDDKIRIKKNKQNRLRDYGIPLIHGDTHQKEKTSYSDNKTLQICVGLNAWDMKSIAKETLSKILYKETHIL